MNNNKDRRVGQLAMLIMAAGSMKMAGSWSIWSSWKWKKKLFFFKGWYKGAAKRISMESTKLVLWLWLKPTKRYKNTTPKEIWHWWLRLDKKYSDTTNQTRTKYKYEDSLAWCSRRTDKAVNQVLADCQSASALTSPCQSRDMLACRIIITIVTTNDTAASNITITTIVTMHNYNDCEHRTKDMLQSVTSPIVLRWTTSSAGCIFSFSESHLIVN